MQSDELEQYTRDALDLLRASLLFTAAGQTAFYRVAAAQLRLLLCDTTRRHGEIVDIALLPQIQPELTLARLSPAGDFDPALPPLPLADWLEQSLPGFGAPLTIRGLIRKVCDLDGGAHVDLRPGWGSHHRDRAVLWIMQIGAAVLTALGLDHH